MLRRGRVFSAVGGGGQCPGTGRGGTCWKGRGVWLRWGRGGHAGFPPSFATLWSAGLAQVGRRYVVHATALAQWLAGGPGHPVGGGPRGGHPLRPRLGSHVHEDGRGVVQHRREGGCGLVPGRGHAASGTLLATKLSVCGMVHFPPFPSMFWQEAGERHAGQMWRGQPVAQAGSVCGKQQVRQGTKGKVWEQAGSGKQSSKFGKRLESHSRRVQVSWHAYQSTWPPLGRFNSRVSHIGPAELSWSAASCHLACGAACGSWSGPTIRVLRALGQPCTLHAAHEARAKRHVGLCWVRASCRVHN